MDDNWQRLVRKMYTPTETEPDRETVNGELIEINFADRQITILPIGSTRQLRVTYQDAMEDLLLENRRSTIQITGRVSRDENGEIKNMFDLESIGTLDLSPLEVNEVEHEGLRLRFKEAVRLQPRLNDDNPQFVSIEDPSLGLDAFAGTVSDLLDEVAEGLVVVWKHYAKAPDANLSPKALELNTATRLLWTRFRLAVRAKRDVEAALKKKGFQEDDGDHHWFSGRRMARRRQSARRLATAARRTSGLAC